MMIKLVVVVVLLLIVVRGFNYNSYNNRWISKSLSIKTSSKVPVVSSIVSSLSLKRLKSSSLHVSTNDEIIVTDEQLEEWLDDMMYSGDINGYIDRNSR